MKDLLHFYQKEIFRLKKELTRALDWDLSVNIIEEIQKEILKYEQKIKNEQKIKKLIEKD